jgi:hypothetical protein
MLEAGLIGKWQKRNLSCAGYLLDLLSIGASEHFSTEEVYLTAGLVVVGAVNCCQEEQITDRKSFLVKLARAFLVRYYNATEELLGSLMLVLEGVAKHRLWEKLSLVPAKHEEKETVPKTEEEKLTYLNRLEFIPFSEPHEPHN